MRVKVQIHHDKIRRLFDRTATELLKWADEVGREIDKVTPEATGELIRSRSVPRVTVGGEERATEIWWFWLADHSAVVEFSWGGKFGPRIPGRIAPFARPTIKRMVDQTLGEAIGKAWK